MGGDDNNSGIIKIAVGVGVTLLSAALVFAIYYFFSGKVNKLVDDGGKMIDSAAEAAYTEKNGEVLSGSTVLNFIKERETMDDEIPIIVKTKGGNTTTYVYDATYTKIANNADLIKKAKTKSDAAYIAPNGKFLATIHKTNDVITDITFEQQ